LCGLSKPASATEDAGLVDCLDCIGLMRPKRAMLLEFLRSRFPNGLDGEGTPGVYRFVLKRQLSLSVWKMFKDSFFITSTTGELWEIGPVYRRRVPGLYHWESPVIDHLVITEVSLVDVGANPFARIAMFK
jgi:hypothetical protein